ncbi:MAG: hypothetical protein IPK83_10700 [Planctomycetes bacterium]|nr:hypothetical protein [Planctomycetota bacterium]
MSSRNLGYWFVVCIVASSCRVAFAQNGACCDDLTGTCTTDVLEANCQGPDFRFHGGNNCSLFNPPCGEGACCLGLGGPCQIQTEANCTLLEGVAWVRGELCSANMCADCDGSLVADGFEIDQGIVPDCNNNGIPDGCDIANNPGIDCNINGIPDSCDIANDPSSDCNNNNTLDVCEIDMNSPAPGGPYFCSSGCDPDCNENGVPDACDIAPGDPDGNGDTSPDCNHNGKPDECEIDENSPAPGGPWYCTSNCLDDCDDDGIPDVCEIPENCSAPGGPYFCEEPGCNPDCNNNGIPDNCDIAAGTSLDVNPADGIPDECRYWTGASTVDDNWFTPENWQPQTVPNNAGAVRFCAVIDGHFSVILDQNAAVDTLKLLGTSTLTHATGSLTIDSINGVVNEGTIVVNDQRSLTAGDSFAMTGDGKVDLNGDNAKIDSTTAGDELTSYVQVEGKGQITGTFVNTSIGEVNANDPTGSIVLTGTIENNGLLAAAIGGTMKILTNISTLGGGQSRIDGHGANVEIGDEDDDPRIVNGDGPIVVRPGSPALLQIEKTSVNNYTSWNIGDNQIGPLMEATANVIAGSSALVAGPLVVDQNGAMNIDASVITSASIELRDGNELNITGGGSLVTTGAFVNRGTVESAYNWGGGTVLRMIGITTSCDVNQWPSKIEAAGTDLGPVNPAGYNNNFDFSVIDVGPNASAVLFDQIDNGNRSGPFGADEAVYAVQLLLGPNSRIHLNGLKLYVAGNQVAPGPFGGGFVQDNGACCLSNGTCVSQSPECCAMADGAFLGFGVDCTPGLCVGACCHLEGYCTETPTESDCLAEGGAFQGLSTSCLTASCPIGNDTCMTAAPLMVGSSVFVNTTDALTDVVPSGNCGTTTLNKGVWFSVVGNGQTITISTCNPGTNFDSMVQVFCECTDFVCVGGNDDATPGDPNCLIAGQNLKSRFSWCTAPGQTFRIQLGGFGTTFGVAELSITTDGVPCGSPPTCIPENRRCCYSDGIAGVCQDLTAGACAAQPFGMWGTVGQTCGTPCPIGRCCYLELGVRVRYIESGRMQCARWCMGGRPDLRRTALPGQ